MDAENEREQIFVSRYIIAYKFILGLLELLLGLGITFFGNNVYRIYLSFRNGELLEDPHDLLVNILEKFMPYVIEHRGFIAIILLVLALVKMVGSIGLLYRKHWGLDLMVGLTIALLPFEAYYLFIHLSYARFAYFLINILIALYLVNFKPKHYFVGLKERLT